MSVNWSMFYIRNCKKRINSHFNSRSGSRDRRRRRSPSPRDRRRDRSPSYERPKRSKVRLLIISYFFKQLLKGGDTRA